MLRVLQCRNIRRYLCTLNKCRCNFEFLKDEKYISEIIHYGVPLPKRDLYIIRPTIRLFTPRVAT